MFANKSLQKTLILLSGAAFLGLMTFPLMNMFRRSQRQQAQLPQQEAAPAPSQEQLQETEKGYETVLAREPNNPVALQGLVETRLQLNNLEGTIEPMEKLIELYPEEEQLQALLAVIKQQLEQPSPAPEQPAGSP